MSVLKGRRRAADQDDFPPGEKEIRVERQPYKTEDRTAEKPGKVPWQRRSLSCCLQAVAPRRPGAEPLASLAVVVLKVIYLRVVLTAQSDNWTDRAICFIKDDHGSVRHSTCELSRIVIVSWSVVVVVQIDRDLGWVIWSVVSG